MFRRQMVRPNTEPFRVCSFASDSEYYISVLWLQVVQDVIIPLGGSRHMIENPDRKSVV